MTDDTITDIFGPPLSSYTWQQGVEDGILVELFRDRWEQLNGGTPILATRSLADEFSQAAFVEMWNGAVHTALGHGHVPDFRLDGGDTVITHMNGVEIWIVYDGTTYTFVKPEER